MNAAAKSRPLRIFYIVSSLEGGGAEFAIPAIVGALSALGHEVRLLFCERRDGSALPRLAQAGLDFTLLSETGDARSRSLRHLFQRARSERPDLIWTSLPRATFEGQMVGRRLGIPIVSWQHSAFTRPYKRLIAPLLQHLSHLWVADSDDVATYLRDTVRVAADRVMTWPLFVAPQAQPQAGAWTGEGSFRIGSVGRLSPHKDYPTLLAAFAQLREIAPALYRRSRLAIAGAGPEQAELERIARDLHIVDRFDLPGFLDDPSEFLAGLHVYAQPSRMEGMCIAAHEAMSAGLPVIATAVGQLRQSVVPDETGFHVAGSDAAGLARRFAELGAAPERAHAMGMAARARVIDRFGEARFAEAAAAIMAHIQQRLIRPHA